MATVLSEPSSLATWSSLSRPMTSKRGIGVLPAHLSSTDAIKRRIACMCSTSTERSFGRSLQAAPGPLAMVQKGAVT